MSTDEPRASGVLLHPTSLPGPHGIGDMGPSAIRWLEWLSSTGSKWWQILPLGPTGFGDSPYQCFSSVAGNPWLVSPELLVEDGLLRPHEAPRDGESDSEVDFGAVITKKSELFDLAMERVRGSLADEFDDFCREEAEWLDDFTLFMALKDRHAGRPWSEWSDDLRLRDPEAVASARRELDSEVRRHAFRQWQFFRQWTSVREAARAHGISVFGDMPLYVAADSADVWSRPDLFELDDQGRPTVVAGVPPDYFSPTGQLWGNPIYQWDNHAAEGYGWWIDRIRRTLRQVDLIRIDHFRAFADYWEVPAGRPTAEIGRWVDGPGIDVFEALTTALGDLPLIAEDLGDLSPAVGALREATGLPGMTILQFAWDGEPDNPFLPHLIEDNTVAYTGTHDNDTTRGWFASVDADERERVTTYLDSDGATIAWELIETAWASPAHLAVAPMQDLLDLPTEHRMNTPGQPNGNWRWRMAETHVSTDLGERLADLNRRTGRFHDA